MGNFMIGNFYPPYLGRIDKVFCGHEQCWPSTNIVIPQGGFGIRFNGELKEFFPFADVYDNYSNMAVDEQASINRTLEIDISRDIEAQITGRCNIYKDTDETTFECNFICRYVNYITGYRNTAEYYHGYAETEDGIEFTDLNKTYIWDINCSASSMTSTLQSSEKTLYKNYGSIYIVRERNWTSYDAHQLLGSFNLLDEFLPLWNAGLGSSRKEGSGTFNNDGQPFANQNYTWVAISNRASNADTMTLTITLGGIPKTLTFVDNSETPAPIGNYGLCQDHVVLITSTGPVVYSYWPQSLQRTYRINNWYTFHNTQNTKYNRGAETDLDTTWIDLILYTKSPLKQRILNYPDYTDIGEYSSWWRYNVKDNSIWRKVQIIDRNGANILDTTTLVNNIYKVDPCIPKWENPDLPAILMRINNTYRP